jgi:alkylglycerol monooxygenase
MFLGALAVFIAVILAEALYARWRGLDVYRFEDTAAHAATGIGQMVFNVLTLPVLALAYEAIRARAGLFPIQRSDPGAWAALVLAVDLGWYAGHRASHRITFFIASHAVHHQALDFNHGSALRQTWWSRPIMFIFAIPLAVTGFPAEMVLAVSAANTLVQFFSHNGLITRRLGWLEHVLVTPRTHRVHHGVNARYVDRNFGGMFIFWDKLFGTFADLDDAEEVVLGGPDRVGRLHPFRSNFDYFRRILFVFRRSRGLRARARRGPARRSAWTRGWRSWAGWMTWWRRARRLRAWRWS